METIESRIITVISYSV